MKFDYWLFALMLGTSAALPSLGFARELKVVSFNVWGLPAPLLRHGERFEKLPGKLSALDADVVLIQEAFTHRADALTHLAKFPYFVRGPRSKFLHFSSGLMILSKYPIEQSATITYSRCGGFDCFANKGAVYARIRVPEIGSVSVFDTHLNANGHDDVRASQAAHLMRFVHAYSQGLPTVVGGDFNGETAPLFQPLKDAASLRDAHAAYVNTHDTISREVYDEYTADPRNNPFLGRSETRRRLDHLYVVDPSPERKWNVVDFGLIFDGKKDEVLSDHFGVRMVAELSPHS